MKEIKEGVISTLLTITRGVQGLNGMRKASKAVPITAMSTRLQCDIGVNDIRSSGRPSASHFL